MGCWPGFHRGWSMGANHSQLSRAARRVRLFGSLRSTPFTCGFREEANLLHPTYPVAMTKYLVNRTLILLFTAPSAVFLTFMTHPFWRWLDENTRLESFGHSGPAEWCFLIVYGILVAICFGASVRRLPTNGASSRRFDSLYTVKASRLTGEVIRDIGGRG